MEIAIFLSLMRHLNTKSAKPSIKKRNQTIKYTKFTPTLLKLKLQGGFYVYGSMEEALMADMWATILQIDY